MSFLKQKRSQRKIANLMHMSLKDVNVMTTLCQLNPPHLPCRRQKILYGFQDFNIGCDGVWAFSPGNVEPTWYTTRAADQR